MKDDKHYQIVIFVDPDLYEKWIEHNRIVRGYRRSRYGKTSIMRINARTFERAIKDEMNKRLKKVVNN